jgi:hypothetical protein
MSVVERPMSFAKTLPGDKITSLAAAAGGTVILWSVYILRPEIGGVMVTIVASMITFLIGRAFSSRNFLASALPPHGRAVKGFYQTAPVAARKRPSWLAPIPLRELANGNFRVEDWQHGEYA